MTHYNRATSKNCQGAGSAKLEVDEEDNRRLILKYQSDDAHALDERRIPGT